MFRFFILFILLVSCKETRFSEEENVLNRYLKQFESKKHKSDIYIYLPNKGCKGCILKLRDKLKTCKNNSNTTIITPDSNYHQFLSHFHVLNEDESTKIKFGELFFVYIYPIFIHLKDGKIIEKIELTPENEHLFFEKIEYLN